MKPTDLIKALAERAPMSDRAMSLALGKTGGWVYNTVRNNGIPRLDTTAAVADLAGCDVLIVDRATGETIATIDPPRRED